MALIPIYQEIRFDIRMWNDGKDDKPWSTIIRVWLFVVLGLITGWILDGNFWIVSITAGLFFGATHYLLFNPWLNISRFPHKSIGYRKEGEWWYGKPYIMEYFAKIWLWYVSWLLLFHWDFVQGNYETVGTWWELVNQFITF